MSELHDLADFGYDTPLLSLAGWSGEGRVVDVYDGDSAHVVVRFRGEPSRVRVRLLGIDTCEIRDRDPENRALAYAARDRFLAIVTSTRSSDWAGASRAAVRERLAGACHVVRLTCEDTDKYGRTLAVVTVDSEGDVDGGETVDVGETLVREGLAYRYDGGSKRSGDGMAEGIVAEGIVAEGIVAEGATEDGA